MPLYSTRCTSKENSIDLQASITYWRDQMITLCSIPKPFKGHIGIIQRNAIRSWSALPGCDVILFGEEEGLAQAAAELGVRHVPRIGRNEQGTPLVSEAFEQARGLSEKPLIAFVNADIILKSDFLRAAERMLASQSGNFLVIGQRHDLDVPAPLEFAPGWEEVLEAEVARRGTLHGKAGIDYFLFPRDFSVRMPPFAVGRPGWDSWFVYHVRAIGVPLVDATESVMVIHQNHPPAYKSNGVEAQRHTHLAGGFANMGTIRDANWRLTGQGLARFPVLRSLGGAIMFSLPARALLAAKRNLQAMRRPSV